MYFSRHNTLSKLVIFYSWADQCSAGHDADADRATASGFAADVWVGQNYGEGSWDSYQSTRRYAERVQAWYDEVGVTNRG